MQMQLGQARCSGVRAGVLKEQHHSAPSCRWHRGGRSGARGSTAVASSAPSDPTTSSKDPLMLRAVRGEQVERAPCWMMRQAGRCACMHLSIRVEGCCVRMYLKTDTIIIICSFLYDGYMAATLIVRHCFPVCQFVHASMLSHVFFPGECGIQR